MAQSTAIRNAALPYPIYGAPYAVVFPIRDTFGNTVAAAAGLTSNVSLNGNTSAATSNTVTEIANGAGTYFLIFNSTEMTADITSVVVKSSTTNAMPTAITLYPRKLPTLRANTTQTGNSTTLTLDTSASTLDDFYTGCPIKMASGTNTEVRTITGYVGSTKVATVTPNWVTTANSTSTYTVYNPEGRPLYPVNVLYVNSATADIATNTLLATVSTKTTLIPGTQDGYTYAQTILLMASALLGKASGLGTTNAVFRALDDSKNRISANVDSSGNRLEVTRDPT